MRKTVAEIIVSLKEIKHHKDLNINTIYNMVMNERPEDCPSISTIRSIFQEGSESKKFDYEQSIKPIAAVLLGVDAPVEEYNKNDAETYFLTQETFKAIVREKNLEIERKNSIIDILTQEKQYLIQEVKDVKSVRDRLLSIISKISETDGKSRD